MFDRFTDGAMKTVSYASMAAEGLNYDYIGTECLLLGLVNLNKGIAAEALANLDIHPEVVIQEVAKYVKPGEKSTIAGSLPFTPRSKKILELSIQEATNYKHNRVDTGHLLLGMYQVYDGLASAILQNLGAKPGDLREEVEAVWKKYEEESTMEDKRPPNLEKAPIPVERKSILEKALGLIGIQPQPSLDQASLFNRFTDRARNAMTLSREEAVRLNHDFIGTEHMLLGIVREGGGVAAAVLEELKANSEQVRAEIEKLAKPHPGPAPTGPLPFTPRAKRVLEYAIEEAVALDHQYVGTEHLLLGLSREEEGIAAQVFKTLGLTQKSIRKEVMEFLGGDSRKLTEGSDKA